MVGGSTPLSELGGLSLQPYLNGGGFGLFQYRIGYAQT